MKQLIQEYLCHNILVLVYIGETNKAASGARLATGVVGLALSVPVILTWDNGIKQFYHLTQKSKPVSSWKHHSGGSIKIAETNTWSRMDCEETVNTACKCSTCGMDGSC